MSEAPKELSKAPRAVSAAVVEQSTRPAAWAQRGRRAGGTRLVGVGSSLLVHALAFALLAWPVGFRAQAGAGEVQARTLEPPVGELVEAPLVLAAAEPGQLLPPAELPLDEPRLIEREFEAQSAELEPAPKFTPVDAALALDPATSFAEAAQVARAGASAESGEAGLGQGGAAGAVEPGQAARLPEYFPAQALESPRPQYPHACVVLGEQGSVGCRLAIDPEGRVSAVEITASSGHPRLDQAAREGLLLWRFQPARLGLEPVRATLDVPVIFRLEDS